MALFFADEDFDLRVVEALRRLGHDVQRHQEDTGAVRGEIDAAVLARALLHGRILLTHNRRDFVRLHRAGARHAGVLAVPQHPDTAGAAAQIDALLAPTHSMEARLFRVNRPPLGAVEERAPRNRP